MIRRSTVRALAIVGGCSLAAVASGAAPPIALEQIAGGLDQPVGLTHAGDGSGRLFIVTRSGRIWIHDGDGLLAEPFLDLRDRVDCCAGERGLSGLAFSPGFAANGTFYVAYDGDNTESVVSRFRVSEDRDRADPDSEVELLRIPQPFANHNLGHIAFGPDGYLYIASGDGGSGGDPMNNAQDLGSLLGKLLRIDVESGPLFAIPPDNPFVDQPGARGEIWAYGIRNAWRFSFDRRSGDLYFGDVGQDAWEEVDYQPASSVGGENYGWRLMEGGSCFDPPSACNDGSLTLPILEYPHVVGGTDLGCRSVTGGFRYRGPRVPTLPRFYLFGDFCSGEVWGARRNAAGGWVTNRLLDSDLLIVSFGEDQRGRLYLVDLQGGVYRVVGEHIFESGFESGFDGWSRRGNVELASPGLRGSEKALEVALDGRRTVSAVRSRQPRGETTFWLAFDLKAGGADLDGQEVEILRLVDGGPHVKLVLEPDESDRRLALLVRTGPGSFRRMGASGPLGSRRVRVALNWLQASAPGVADGEVALKIGGRKVAQATDLDNRGRRVKAVAVGLPAGSDGTAGGSLLIDNYRSTP